MKVWVSKHTYRCRTPKQIKETPMADLRHRVGGPPQVFHQLVWVYGGKMVASTPTVSYNFPPMLCRVDKSTSSVLEGLIFNEFSANHR